MNIFLNVILPPLFQKARLCHLKCNFTTCVFLRISRHFSENNLKSNFNILIFHMSTNTENDIFKGKLDRYNGITVHSNKERCGNVDEFTKKLEDSLKIWKEVGRRGIWFRVNLNEADWVPILAKKGFKFHHAQDEFVMMYLWLPPTENCNIPRYAHTMIGVGAVVVNDKEQVLVVQEKYAITQRPLWKLPGGYTDPGENLVDTAIREVYEETNICTEFKSILTLRHAHRGMFGCSDIYAVVSLKPLSQDIIKCEREIQDCKWMDINEYLSHPNVHELNRFFVQKYLEYIKHNIKISCFHGVHEIINKPYTVYSVTKEITEENAKNEEVSGDQNIS